MADRLPTVLNAGQFQQLQSGDLLAAQTAQVQGYGAYATDVIDIAEPGTWEIPSTGFLEIGETQGPAALLSYSLRVHPYQNEALAETSSLQVLDYYDVTEPYTLEIPATALMEIVETSGAADFDIS